MGPGDKFFGHLEIKSIKQKLLSILIFSEHIELISVSVGICGDSEKPGFGGVLGLQYM